MKRAYPLTQTPIRVVIADDHPVIIEGITAELQKHADLLVVGSATSFTATRTLLETTPVDVVILDLMGMQGSPIATITTLRKQFPSLGIVIFSSMLTMARAYLRAGITGYVAKDDPLSCLVTALHAAGHRGTYFSPTVEAYLENTAQQGQAARLTQREVQVLQLLSRGLGTVEMAEALNISAHAVHNLFGNIRQKTGCVERVELVDWYRRVYGETDVWE